MRSTPQLPLATPKDELEIIFRKGKAPREGTSTAEPCISNDFHFHPVETQISTSHFPIIPSVGVS